MLIFDMDGTICESKQKISKEMKDKLATLGSIAVISGASREQMEKQLDGLECTILAQCGNDTPLWQNKLNFFELWEIKSHVRRFGNPRDNRKFENRGSQIAYSFIGHNAKRELKLAYDPEGKVRQEILEKYPFKSKTLKVKIGGTTCLDYTKYTKGDNIARWIKENKLKKKDCVYYGDALFKGGNDESVIGVIKTIAVTSPADLLKKL